jgi:ribonuclease Y
MGLTITLIVAALLIGAVVGYIARRYSGANKIAEAETKAKEIVLEAKEKAASLLLESKNEEKDRRKEIDSLESRLLHREETLDKKLTELSLEGKSARKRR